MSLICAPLMASVGVYPNLNGIGGIGRFEGVIGALMSIVLVAAVLMIVVCAAAWAIGSWQANPTVASRARAGLLVGVAAAVLDGAGIAWLNFLIHIGPTL
jgi:Family of unknown function (DUF6112)